MTELPGKNPVCAVSVAGVGSIECVSQPDGPRCATYSVVPMMPAPSVSAKEPLE